MRTSRVIKRQINRLYRKYAYYMENQMAFSADEIMQAIVILEQKYEIYRNGEEW